MCLPQGDVIGLFDDYLNVVVEYTYDSWGKVETTGTLKDTLGKANPFRYRGYYYDEESGLYYLNSRYYHPEIGRFINADDIVTTGSDLNGTNLFAYCGNNPVNFYDSTGQGRIWNWINNNIIQPLKNIANAAVKSFEFEVGFGYGLKGSGSLGSVDVDAGFKGDMVNIEYTNKNGLAGRTKLDAGLTIGAGPIEIGNNFGEIHNYSCDCNFIGVCPHDNSYKSDEPIIYDPCIEIIGIELYFFVGGNVQVRFNTDTFLGELGVIELYEE